MDVVEKRKTPSPRRESNPRTPLIQPVASRYTDWATPAHIIKLAETNYGDEDDGDKQRNVVSMLRKTLFNYLLR
jgi:hypothetical protein